MRGISGRIERWLLGSTILGAFCRELGSLGWERLLNRRAGRIGGPVHLENVSTAWTRQSLAVDQAAGIYDYGIDPVDALSRPDPKVSVIMPVYNGADLIGFSIDSMLSQTFADFELIIVDDGSTDHTVNVLKSYRDPRLRIIPLKNNVGVVGARNTALKVARGTYVAMLDHDDLSAPTRLEKQVKYLDENPDAVAVAADGRIFQNGLLREFNFPKKTTPILIEWMLNMINPLSFSSVMLRRSAISALFNFTDSNFECAEDFHLYHKILKLGKIFRIDAPLNIYRLHGSNMTSSRGKFVLLQAARVLAEANGKWLGSDAKRAARLFSCHIMAMQPVTDATTLLELGRDLERLMQSFLAGVTDHEARAEIQSHAGQLWWRTVRIAVRTGRPWLMGCYQSVPALCAAAGVGRAERLEAILRGWLMTVGSVLKGPRNFLRSRNPGVRREPFADVTLFGMTYRSYPLMVHRPPTLYVVVDAQAGSASEGDFGLDAHLPVQAFLDGYGLRPVYFLDDFAASQGRTRDILLPVVQRHGCVLGAYTSASTTGPRPGASQATGIAALVDTIEQNFGERPLFHMAADGIAPGTFESLTNCGIAADFSIVPGETGDFQSGAYQVAGDGPLFLPATRGFTGRLSAYGSTLDRWFGRKLPNGTRIRNLACKLGLLEAVSLAPERFSADQQIAVIRSMMARGQRVFVLHYGSRSFLPEDDGSTTSAEIVEDRIRRLCTYFFDELGGLPGYPLDLVPVSRRPGPPDRAVARSQAFLSEDTRGARG